MVKFTVHGDGRTLIGLGLSRGNIQRLQQGQPILLKLEDVGITADPPIDVLIVFGENEASIIHDVDRRLGLEIGPDTIVRIDPKLKS